VTINSQYKHGKTKQNKRILHVNMPTESKRKPKHSAPLKLNHSVETDIAAVMGVGDVNTQVTERMRQLVAV
jgi:hypothetical protein